ncbi:MAG: PTS sugar transporter subunit IIA [Planctomycetaceae bacterium]|nr:PTS sugar transporter subunit IIA [Planctomycetaceae bacterium]
MGKSSVISLLVESLAREEQIHREHAENLIRELMEMERRGSSAVDGGIALPHLETSAVQHMTGGIGIAREGLHFDSPDGEPTHLVFLILAPPGNAQKISKLRVQLADKGRRLLARQKGGPPLMCDDVFTTIGNLEIDA